MNTKEEKKQQIKKVVMTTAYVAGCVGLTILGWKAQKKIVQKWAREAMEK